MIKKILAGFVIILLVLLIALAAGRNSIVKAAITAGVRAGTGLTMSIDTMNIGVMKTLVGIKGLKLYNPPAFEDAIMVDAPEIYVEYDLNAFFKEKKIHLQEVRLNLNEFFIVKNKDGVLNLDSLKPVQSAKAEEKSKEKKPKEKAQEIQIDVLQLKLKKVIVKDYTGGREPKVREYNLNIDERYENITNPQSVASIIVVKAMSNAAIAKFADMDLGALKDGLKGTVGDTGELLKGLGIGALDGGKDAGVKDAAGEAVKRTTGTLKRIFPLGGSK